MQTPTRKQIDDMGQRATKIVRDAGPGMHHAYSPAWTASYAIEQCSWARSKLGRNNRMAAEHFENARKAVEDASRKIEAAAPA